MPGCRFHRAPVALALALLLAGSGAAHAAGAPSVTPLGAYRVGLTAPARVAADALGRLVVTEPGAGRIVVYDPFGRVQDVREGFDEPLAIAVDAAGRIVVSEAGRGRVRVFDAAWTLLRELGGGDGEFLLPGYVAVDPVAGSDRVWVSDGAANQVKVYTNGVFAFACGSSGSGPGQLNFPAGLVVGTNAVSVVDQNNNRINVYSRDGAFLRELPLEVAGGRVLGLAGDQAGRLYATDAFQGLVRVLDAVGTNLTTVGAFGEAEGKLRTPVDAVADPFGRLFVVAPNNSRVELFGLDDFVHVTASPGDGVLATGTTCVLSVITGGAGPFAYHWLQGTNVLADGGTLTGATGAVLTVTGLGAADAGDYTVSISGPRGVLTPAPTRLAVLAPPAVRALPASQVVAEGEPAWFTTSAQGDALSFQWSHGGQLLDGATNAELAFDHASAADGGEYRVEARNALGQVSSLPVTLQVLRPPRIVLPPIDRVAVRGDAAPFDVSAEGDALTYQWRVDGADIPGAQGADLLVSNVQPDAAGRYDVVIANPVGVVTSAAALLQVLLPPGVMEITTIAPQPDSSVHVDFMADTGLTYRVESSPDLVDWTRRTNVTTQTGTFQYQDPEAAGMTQGFYRLRWLP